jgi:hypothetical protein
MENREPSIQESGVRSQESEFGVETLRWGVWSPCMMGNARAARTNITFAPTAWLSAATSFRNDTSHPCGTASPSSSAPFQHCINKKT